MQTEAEFIKEILPPPAPPLPPMCIYILASYYMGPGPSNNSWKTWDFYSQTAADTFAEKLNHWWSLKRIYFISNKSAPKTSMTPEGYVNSAIRTESKVAVNLEPEQARILHAALGLVTEAGEFADTIKKWLFYQKPFDLTNLKEEAGDLFWYIAIVSDALGINFSEIMESNISKLKARYPDRFTQEAALNRDLNKELDALTQPSA